MGNRFLNMAKALFAAGFYIGPRDWERNSLYDGEWMVCENLDVGPTQDASTGGYCIVGDDLNDLIWTAYHHGVANDYGIPSEAVLANASKDILSWMDDYVDPNTDGLAFHREQLKSALRGTGY